VDFRRNHPAYEATIPPPPKTPTLGHVRGPGWSIPGAVAVALITTLGTTIATRVSAPDDTASLRAEVRELRDAVSQLRLEQTALLTKLNGLEDANKNAELIKALREGKAP